MVDIIIDDTRENITVQLATADELCLLRAPHHSVGGYLWALRVDEGQPTLLDVTDELVDVDKPRLDQPIGGGVTRTYRLSAPTGCTLALSLVRPWAPHEPIRAIEIVILAPVAA